ncbi:UDP-glucose dehydrogenase family protein [Oceanobacillus rekensis]|uniref:UDP-glucose dehydrogenase family protein n=1 Tax=Oceanobacillus rekensis TaxID=937927 RepID=UPI000B439B14|nr:UDP-glucose/GDP-mannose dehydrogenase family protein [Oceanobacillus rekensis]
MKVLIIGMGYVGTTMGVVFANAGHEVTGLDIDEGKIDSLKKGKLYFYEPGLQEMLVNQMDHQRLSFTTDTKKAIENHDILFITVGTPPLENGNADLTYLKKVAQMIGRFKNREKTIIVKSTVPIGTTSKVEQWISEAGADSNPVNVAMNPEFLREGSALQDALYPDRIIIGSDNKTTLKTLHKLYQSFSCPILKTTAMAAETIKYASNAFLATKISFINEMAKLCDTLGVNIKDVSKGMGLDDRIGPHFLEPGLGYGGSCFPKDIKELLLTADTYQRPLHLLKEVEKINKNQSSYFIEKVKNSFDTLEGKRIAIFGLAFKSHTDDTRESVSFPIIDQLLEEKSNVVVHDPVVQLSKDWVGKGVQQSSDPYEAVKGCDAILICTNWPVYKELDWERVHQLVKQPYIFDGRNMLEAKKVKDLQFHYKGIGYS